MKLSVESAHMAPMESYLWNMARASVPSTTNLNSPEVAFKEFMVTFVFEIREGRGRK